VDWIVTGSVASSTGVAGAEWIRTCDLCGSTHHEVLLAEVRDRLHGLPGRFGLIRCGACGLVRLSPRPDASSLPAYYPEDDYYAYQAAGPAGVADRPLARARDALRAGVLRAHGYGTTDSAGLTGLMPSRLPRWLERRAMYDCEGFPSWVPGGHALDIGCGNGRFLDRIRRHGWQVVGVDTSTAAAVAARESFGITVHVGALEDSPIAERSLDFVHMSHVIEHLPQPVDTLRRISQLLRPGGRLYIETPNIDSLAFRWSREYWFGLDPPRHLWLFAPATLSRALAESGFTVDRLRALSFPTFDWEATYRREQREGRMLPKRPATWWRNRPRIAALGAITAGAGRLSPRLGDILSCWAQLSPGPLPR
jgi:SAM-dependent methyltransferase